MPMENQENTYKALWEGVFKEPLLSVLRGFKRYLNTIYRIHLPNRLLNEQALAEERFFSPVKFLLRTFEYLLVVLVLQKSFGSGIAERDDIEQRFGEIAVLFFLWLAAVLFITFARGWRSVLRIQTPKFKVDGLFLYEYAFLFLVAYLAEVIFKVNAQPEGSIAEDWFFGFLFLHQLYYFLLAGWALKINKFALFPAALVATLTGFFMLAASVGFMIGLFQG